VNQLELAEIFAVDRNTLAGWTRAGMPVAHRGRGSRGHQYDVGGCVRWLRARERAEYERALAVAKAASPVLAARARKWTADARRSELEVKKREGELVLLADYERAEAGRIVLARNHLLGLPTRAKQRLPHLSTADVRAIDELVRESLEQLADAKGATT
jgi:phage terminase Nu1 subunit (DNA packaging protein)